MITTDIVKEAVQLIIDNWNNNQVLKEQMKIINREVKDKIRINDLQILKEGRRE